jgi:iron only hydrogenase large subunit-like protein
MTTSCCAGYNQLIKKHLPEIKPFVSTTGTPTYYISEIIKKEIPDAVTVFVSPCVAKRTEGFENPNVDYVMNFEELGALFVAKKIQITECEEGKYAVESSKHARNFGFTGGVADSVKASLRDESIINPCVINGLNKESIRQLKRFATTGQCDGGCNMVEVMCCEGGCIGGNATMNNQKTAKKLIDALAAESKDIEKI